MGEPTFRRSFGVCQSRLASKIQTQSCLFGCAYSPFESPHDPLGSSQKCGPSVCFRIREGAFLVMTRQCAGEFCPLFEQPLKELIREVAAEHRADILELEVMPDHVHLLTDPLTGVNPVFLPLLSAHSSSLYLYSHSPGLSSRPAPSPRTERGRLLYTTATPAQTAPGSVPDDASERH